MTIGELIPISYSKYMKFSYFTSRYKILNYNGEYETKGIIIKSIKRLKYIVKM